MCVNRKSVFNDAAMIRRNVMGTVYDKRRSFQLALGTNREIGGTHPVKPSDIVVFTVHILPADIRIRNRSDL